MRRFIRNRVPITTIMIDQGFYRLVTWLSPAFPVGAFSYSHGIEYAVESGQINDVLSLTAWLRAILIHGAGRTDSALLLAAFRAQRDGDPKALAWAIERADAMRGTSETALESRSQGTAFLTTLRAAWPAPALEALVVALDEVKRPPAYSVAVGIAACMAGVEEGRAVLAYLQAFAANLVSAGLRLVPLGQTDGQRALATLETDILAAAEAACLRPLEDIGGAAPIVDWTSMQHETQYTRLFRS